MSEADDAVPVEPHDILVRGGVEQCACVVEDARQQRQSRPLASGDRGGDANYVRWQPGNALANQLVQRIREWERARRGRRGLGELQRVHRIATRRGVHARDRSPWQANAEPRPDEVVESTDAE